MARKLRVEYPGAIYHLRKRGERGESIFKDDEDRQRFLGTLGEACVKTGWQVHAYCLMSNHFHLVIETKNVSVPAIVEFWLRTRRVLRRYRSFPRSDAAHQTARQTVRDIPAAGARRRSGFPLTVRKGVPGLTPEDSVRDTSTSGPNNA